MTTDRPNTCVHEANQKLTDCELREGWHLGNQWAGDALFRRYWPAMLRFFTNKARGVAEDLAQTTLLTCLESAAKFENRASFRTYLFRIARFQLWHHFRSAATEGKYHWEVNAKAFRTQKSPSVIAAKNREDRALIQAIARLPLV